MAIRLVLFFVVASLTLIGQSISTALEALNRTADSQTKLTTSEAKQRSALLHQLIAQDPKRAIELARFETASETEGILEATVEDDFARRRSQTRWALRTPTGIVDLYFAGNSPEGAGCGRTLSVSGIRVGTRIAVSEFTAEARALPELTSSQCAAFSSGTRNVAVLMLQTPASTLPSSVTSTFLANAFFGSGQSLRSYWSEVSYGRVTASGSVFGPFLLDANYTCDQLEPILSAAIRAADASVDFTQYHHVVMIIPNNAAGCSVGTASFGCRFLTSSSRGSFSSGVSWLRADYLSRNDAAVSVAAHELGHNIGLDHANTMTYPTIALGDPAAATFDEYGDYFSAMGLSLSFNGSTLIGHYGAPHKSRLGWFGATNITTVTTSGTYTIAPLETTTTSPQALRIRRSTDADLWIEFRRNSGFDATTATVISDFNGAWIRYQSPSLAFDESYTNLLNFHPGTDVENSLLRVGETWQDPSTTLRLRVDTATNAGLTITVTDPPAIGVPTLTTLSTSPNPALASQQFTLTVNGSGFDPATAQVIVGSTTIANSSLTSKSATQLQLNQTRVAGTYNVTARNGSTGIASNALTVTVTTAASTPTISTLTPNPVASGAGTFTITGTNFNTTTAQVEVNGTVITPSSRTATQLVFSTLVAAGSYSVIVRNGTGEVASNAVTLTANSPTLATITPNPATAGSNTFTIVGTNFNATTAQVEVGATVITPSSRTATQLVFTTTLAAGSYSVLVRNGSGGTASNTVTLTVNAAVSAPTIGLLTPNPTASGAGTFTVTGTNFNTTTAQVEVNGTVITPSSRTATQLVFSTLVAAGSYSVIVRNGTGEVASNAVTLTANSPTLATITPNPATAGSNTFTIVGTNFNATTAQVEVGATVITPSSRTATQLVFTTTLAAGSYSVLVRNGSGGTGSNIVTLTVNTPVSTTPTIASLTPNPATAGSNAITLTGTNFNTTTAQVEIGATVFTPSSRTATQLVFTTTLQAGSYSLLVRNGSGGTASNTVTLTVNTANSSGSYFVPITPCRAVDTRPNSIMARDSSRNFTFGNCSIPSNATALALNVTLVPSGQFGFLSIWPAGQSQPVVSTMNSLDGRIKANAAIVGTGTGGAVSVYVTDPAHILFDVNGYFVPAGTAGALAFYPLDPCRIVDTRNTGGIVNAQETRRISGGCLPSGAQAYSLNITSVPPAPLGFLTLWPDGSTQPTVSTLNNLTGTVVANAAILRSGTGGAFNAYVTDASHLIADLNGYFAPPGSPGALAFYPSTPCRIFDTRNPNGAFGGPAMAADTTRSFTVPSSACGIPTTAQAYVTNATMVPSGVFGFLTMWQGGQTRPQVSTLNAVDGALTSNAAIIPTNISGVIQVYTSNTTHMLLDISGFFAP